MKKTIGLVMLIFMVVAMVPLALSQGSWETVKDPVKVFEEGYIQVVGASEEGQSRYRAVRAAEVVAQRKLLEILQGINLYGVTTVKDGMLHSDAVATTVEGFLRGAVQCGDTYYPDKGYAEVCMRLNIRGKGGLYDIILPIMKDKNIWPEKKPAYQPALIPKAVEPKGVEPKAPEAKVAPPPEQKPEEKAPAPPPEVARPSELTKVYDGLILDVREYQFRPALVNRIITDKEEIVFDPSKVVSTVLVERGCGGFTTDTNKAKALLQSWGCQNPMELKVKSVVKLTDAQVGTDDAAAIYVHDQKSNMLAQAKVVFLLK
ncbi:MAG: hypothetical protein C4582_02765 [Desulfobacteraceae bacterium]|jgi:hypothetical protein|nr:MAG: hypothetical protein C4582_02765 [Desulfobacteraceae bacterium]